ncbi:hypothetical protein F7230_09535 [Corynebacterium sp. 320]|nr:hypothetical protein F7230_09535 [Corynebacterium sp. 320]KAB1551744.1 hypothetical protein F7232_06325 [Corynebacterium sp. 319]KAB3525805.1 hypothetical protein F8354_09535 [Corynebacterium sp. 250]KAB3538739.1 hypothetical protein F8390_06905 [Corynebacterium sp. 366]
MSIDQPSPHPESTNRMDMNPYLGQSAATPPPPGPHTPKPNTPKPHTPHQQPFWKKVLAFLAVGLGAILVLGGLLNGDILYSLCAGLAIALPGIWWLIHENREKNGAEPMKRHWGTITIASIVLFVVSGAFAPEQQGNTTPTTGSATTTTSATATTTTSTTATTSKKPTTGNTTTSEEPIAAENDTPAHPPSDEQPPASQREPEEPINNFIPPVPTPAPKPEYTPAPAYEPAPAPQPVYEPPATNVRTVHPGAYCSGGTGVSKTGKPMVCALASDGRMRWQSAG